MKRTTAVIIYIILVAVAWYIWHGWSLQKRAIKSKVDFICYDIENHIHPTYGLELGLSDAEIGQMRMDYLAKEDKYAQENGFDSSEDRDEQLNKLPSWIFKNISQETLDSVREACDSSYGTTQ